MRRPELSVLVSSYERPYHLRRSLVSLAQQQEVTGAFEVVVTDDGSSGTNRTLVAAFAREVDFRVRFTTHVHDGFRLARCRNRGVAASVAPYLLFTDGDCVLPPDHIREHLEFRRAGRVVVGDCYRLGEAATAQLTEESIRSCSYLDLIAPGERRRLALKAWRAWWYQLLRCPMRPRLTGNNIGVWRTDFERLNGFDENFVGWGLEDRDLQRRLGRLGLRFKSILFRTAACHLWHPSEPSFVRNNVGTRNGEYYRRAEVPTRCELGLDQHLVSAADGDSWEDAGAQLRRRPRSATKPRAALRWAA